MLKNKKIQFLIAIVVACILIFFQNVFANNYKIQATESESSSVSDNKLFGPYLTDDPNDRGKKLTEYDADKAIILEKTSIASLSGKYSFIPRWTEKIVGKNAGTEVLNYGFTEVANAGNGFTGKVYQYTPEDFDSKKPANLTYTNVGLFKGKWIDMRLTVTNVEKSGGFNARGTYRGLLIGGTKQHFNQVRLTRAESAKENEYPSVELTYEYLEHGTENKVEVTGYNVFADLDYRESIFIDEKKMNLQNIIISEGTKLSFKKTDGLLHLMPFVPGENALEDPASREEAKLSWAAYTFGPTTGYPLTFRMSNSTTMADNEGLLPFETDNPNKLGYDNPNINNENKVEFSIYQYTPNNGKNYRYKSFVWLDPIHNAIKVNDPKDVTLRLGQTQEELPKEYYKVTIEPNVEIAAVAADSELGIEAEPASVRDVIRVEFTEQFMSNLKMYGEMLQMDVKGVLNQENLSAVQATYSSNEKAFIIPNRSELHYTDTIVTSESKAKIVSSNTAKAKIKSTEIVQAFVSKTVENKSAAGSGRIPKVGDTLDYEIAVKNDSITPTNVWKDVAIFDELPAYLDIETDTIAITKNGIKTMHPEYYDAKNRKLSLPKQDIEANAKASLQINFSAKINLSGAGKLIENWIYANGFDPDGKALDRKDKATLAGNVENLNPPTITLNEKTGASTGEEKTVTGTFKDIDSDTVTMWYQVDGGTTKQINPPFVNSPKNSDNPYQFTIPKEDLSLGPHIVTIYAIDSEGLKSNLETLTLDGVLQLVSSPKTLNFGQITYDAKDKKVENPKYNEQLVILDSRADTSKGWHLTATLTKPMKNDKGQELVDALQYVNKGKEKTLSNNAQSVYENTEGKEGKFIVSDTWGTTQGTDGIKLKINSADTVYTGEYTGIITWKIMPGQP